MKNKLQFSGYDRSMSVVDFMHANDAWIGIFRRIPDSLHDVLALGLTTGAEIIVQKIIRLDPEFMMIRGRLSGTQDTGRIVMIPYQQLTFVAIQRYLVDTEVEAIFGKGAAPGVIAVPTAAEPAAEAATVNEPPLPVNAPKKPEAVSKAMLLAKLRDRLKEAPASK